MARGKTYWMVASSLKNFNITKDMGFKSQGLMSKQRRKAQRMEPGDRLVFYITGIRKFGATATVTSKCIEDHSLRVIEDHRTAHHLGVNASRAWGLWSVYRATGDVRWLEAYGQHVEASLALHSIWVQFLETGDRPDVGCHFELLL